MNVVVSVIMLLIGFGCLIYAFKINKQNKKNIDQGYRQSKGAFALPAIVGGVMVFLAILILAPFTIISAGHVGVQTLFGKVKSEPLYPGINLVNPLVSVTNFETRTLEYTMVAKSGEGANSSDDSSPVLSKEGLQLSVDMTIFYRIIPKDAPVLYADFGTDMNKFIRPVSRASARDIFAKYDAAVAITTGRQKITDETIAKVNERLHKLMAPAGIEGLEVVDVVIRDISPPTKIKESIEAKQSAQQDAERMAFVLQKEEQEAKRKRIEAEGIRDFQHTVSTGITPDLLTWKGIEATEKIAESPNSKIVIVGGSKNGLPLVLNEK